MPTVYQDFKNRKSTKEWEKQSSSSSPNWRIFHCNNNCSCGNTGNRQWNFNTNKANKVKLVKLLLGSAYTFPAKNIICLNAIKACPQPLISVAQIFALCCKSNRNLSWHTHYYSAHHIMRYNGILIFHFCACSFTFSFIVSEPCLGIQPILCM